MKKILTSLALLGCITSVSYAQDIIDLRAFAIMNLNQPINTNTPISPTGLINNNPAPADSIQGVVLLAVDVNSVPLTDNDTFLFMCPNNVLNSDGTVGMFRGTPNDIVEPDTTWAPIFYLGFLNNTDSINTLLNITNFENDSTLFADNLVRREEFVVGQTYGWYGHIRPYPSWTSASYMDPDENKLPNQMNNWSYTPVIWQGGGTSIKDIIKNTQYSSLDFYPNPTIDKIYFKLDFAKANKSTVVRVLDISGRSLNSKSLGSAGAGTQEYSYNVENLPAGTYTLQVITDNAISVGKFVKK